MLKRRIAILACLLCFCVCLLPQFAQAASTTDAVEPIAPEKSCSLTISYRYGETAFSALDVKLYKIADVSADFYYSLTPSFAASGLILNGIQTSGEWNVVRSTLEAYIVANAIRPDAEAVTDQNGQVCFTQLGVGMYFAVVGEAMQDALHCRFDSALVALPGLNPEGYWQYTVEVSAKPEALPPIEPDEKRELKVLKLWKGDEGRNDRPESIEVEIFRDGVSYETVVLSAETNWCYSWSVPDDGATWIVSERNVPDGYTMTVERREDTFLLTNTWTPDDPDTPVKPPQTGDTGNVLVYILLMGLSGSMLIGLGIAGKRKRV